MLDLSGIDVLIVLASNDFRDEEYREPAEALARLKAGVDVASSSTEMSIGMLGQRVRPDLLLSEVDVSNYAAVIFVGGRGAEEYFNDPVAHRVARDAFECQRFVCAICIAPSILANAGLLKGVSATCYPTERDNLKAKGAKIVEKGVVRDHIIITADGPKHAKAFAKSICDALLETVPEEPESTAAQEQQIPENP